jgi:hypothetical protein
VCVPVAKIYQYCHFIATCNYVTYVAKRRHF